MNSASQRRIVVCALALFAVLCGVDSTWAYHRQHHRGYRGGRGGRYGYRGNPVANAYAAQMRAAAMRMAAIRAAQAEVQRSYNDLRGVRVRLEREFKYSDSLAAAQKDHRDAHLEYNQALEKLRDNPEYEHTLQAVRLAHDRLVALQDRPYSTPQERGALEDKQRTLEVALERMRRDAKAVNPDFEDATRRAFAAAGKQADLRRQFEASITQNAQWTAARANLEKARMQLARAYMAGNSALSYNRGRGRNNSAGRRHPGR